MWQNSLIFKAACRHSKHHLTSSSKLPPTMAHWENQEFSPQRPQTTKPCLWGHWSFGYFWSIVQKPGNHLNFEKNTLSEWIGHSRSNSRNSGVFSEQFSEWLSRPNLCENPVLGETLGATLGIGWTPKFQPNFSELFFQNWGGGFFFPGLCNPSPLLVNRNSLK